MAQIDAEERIYMHLSSQDLICGETLYYSAFCVGDDSQKSSLLSKVLYVEIVSENGVIHQNKISLDKGRGQGELFITSLITTGQYKVIAYTRWMRNFDQYFSAPLTIINPFEVYHAEHVKPKRKTTVDFYPASGSIVSGVPNLMNWKITSAGSNSNENYKLKIVSGDGEMVAEASPDRYGFGQFDWRPKSDMSYRAILEDSLGQFEFFDLPDIIASGTVISIKKRESFYEIGIHTSPSINQIGRLVIRTKTRVIMSKQVALNSVHLEAQSNIVGDQIFLEVFDAKDQVLSRTFILKSQLGTANLNESLLSQYGTRQKIRIESPLDAGSYSISVNKKSVIRKVAHTYAVGSRWGSSDYKFVVEPETYLAAGYSENMNLILLEDKSLNRTFKEPSYMPEYRDEFVDGQLMSDSNKPVSGALVSLSLPEEHPQIRVSKTKHDGSFSIPFESTITEIKSYLTYLDSDSNYHLSIKSPFTTPVLNFEKNPLILDSLQIQEVVDRSIRNQIENAFYHSMDTLGLVNDWQPTIPYTEEYVLDDYTRFRSIKETFVEYITSANVRENRKHKIKVLQQTVLNTGDYPPLLLLNGIPVGEDELLAFSPYKIEKIAVLSRRFFLGPLIVDGVIGFTTKEDHLGGFKLGDNYLSTEMKGLAKAKAYGFPRYESNMETSRPDQRDQLYWNPNILVNEGELLKFDFYTSDVSGVFEIFIEGFTDAGDAVSIVEDFEVKKAPLTQ